MVEIIGFKSTGVREIDLILSAFQAGATNDEIQVVADKAAEIWTILWASEGARD